jgi:acyl-CoA synthetase (AMP-forming)/AMP-acid ligase II
MGLGGSDRHWQSVRIMATLGQIIDRNARHSPDRPAVVCGDLRWTHGQFAARVRRLSGGLWQRGLRHQDRYSVLAMNSSEYLECYGAAQWAGFIINTVNFRLAAPEIAWILQDAAPKLLIFEAQYAELIDELRLQLPGIERYVCIGEPPQFATAWAESYDAVLESGQDSGPPIRSRGDDYCCLVYTSGTTGKPKGVLQSNHSMARCAEIVSSELRLGSDCRLLASAPLFHAGASTMSWGAAFRGGCTILHRGFDAEQVLRTIEAERISAIHLVPTMVHSLLDSPSFGKYDISSLRMLLYAAAPMPLPVLKRAVEAFGPITYNGYGQTEINFIASLQPHQHFLEGTPQQLKRLSSVGQAHWQCDIRILTDDGRDCGPNEIGEVAAKSETAMAGYWDNTVATLATIRDGWVHTGDLGYLDEQGYLFLVDRMKDMIITGGENVYSREVEEAVVQHPAVHEVAVIGIPDPKWGEAVHAVVVLAPGSTTDAAMLIDFCKNRIASYKCPKSISFISALPRLDTGKVNKVILRQQHIAPVI